MLTPEYRNSNKSCLTRLICGPGPSETIMMGYRYTDWKCHWTVDKTMSIALWNVLGASAIQAIYRWIETAHGVMRTRFGFSIQWKSRFPSSFCVYSKRWFCNICQEAYAVIHTWNGVPTAPCNCIQIPIFNEELERTVMFEAKETAVAFVAWFWFAHFKHKYLEELTFINP